MVKFRTLIDKFR